MSEINYDENQLFEMYDYLLQKEKELEAAILKSSPEGLDTAQEKEQLALLKGLVRSEIKDLIQKKVLEGKELSPKSQKFRE